MAITTRYFSTTAATWVTGTAYVVGDYVLGTDSKNWRCILNHTSAAADRPITGANYATYWEECDGTTWDKRAALLVSGNWSAVITGFNFTNDTLICLIGPGSYTCSQTLNNTTITTDPTVAHPIILHGCDSSGNKLSPPDPDWVSAQPVFSDASLPVIATTTNIATVNLYHCHLRLLKFTASARNATLLQGPATIDWCYITNSQNNSAAAGVGMENGNSTISNSYVELTGTNYDTAVVLNPNTQAFNVRARGVGGGTLGTRSGFVLSPITASNGYCTAELCTAYGFSQHGFALNAANTLNRGAAIRCTSVNVGGSCYLGSTQASQTNWVRVVNCIGTGAGAYGVKAESSYVIVVNSRFRDNTSGDFNGFGDIPTDIGNEITDSSDADEYVDAAGGDFRIKNTAAIWGYNYGVADQPPASSAGGSFAFIG